MAGIIQGVSGMISMDFSVHVCLRTLQISANASVSLDEILAERDSEQCRCSTMNLSIRDR